MKGKSKRTGIMNCESMEYVLGGDGKVYDEDG